MNDELEVWIDSDLQPQARVGTLFNVRGNVRFEYDKAWLKGGLAFQLDPGLTLDEAPFNPIDGSTNFGVFLDSTPDRWGKKLMQRREGLQARDDKRLPRNLHAWDFLVGVQDETRQGALRFRKKGSTTWLAAEKNAAPPVTSLRELEVVARALSEDKIDNLDDLRRWLAVLVAPGASLGGARPKANFRETDKSLWIAKFPAGDDKTDTALWEHVLHTLAAHAQIHVPQVKLVRLNSKFHTLCSKRFDRDGQGRRMFYASAFTMLRKVENSDDASYIDIAQFIQDHGASPAEDLAQLFRRVVFNVCVSNRDDHLRNHGFILESDGWRLSPAFDVNPSTKESHVLSIDGTTNDSDMVAVRASAWAYNVSVPQADQIIEQVMAVVDGWESEAARQGLSAGEILEMSQAFNARTIYRERLARQPEIIATRPSRSRRG